MADDFTPLKESDFLSLTSDPQRTQPYELPSSAMDAAPAPTAEMPEGMTAVGRELNPETDTVAGQMKGLLSEGSDWINLNRQQADEDSNRRGLLNSSIATRQGQDAAIASAMPIAQQDATAYLNQGLTNQQFGQEAGRVNSGFRNDWEKANQAYENTWNIFQGEYDRKLEELGANIGGQMDLQSLKQTGSLDLENLRQRGDKLKLDQGSFGSYLNAHAGVQSMMLSEIQSVQQDEGLEASQKQTALDEINDRYGESFEFVDQIFGDAAQSWNWDFIMGPPA
jgi:hypothetical protein